MVKIMYYERKVEPSPQSQMTSFPLQWELGWKFLCSLPLPSTGLKERVGLGRIQEPFHTRGTLRFPFRRVPDDPDHSTQAFGKRPLPLLTTSLLAPFSPLPGPSEQLTFFCKSIIRKGGEKSYNGTKQKHLTLTWGLSASEPQGSRLRQGWVAFSTGSACVSGSGESTRETCPSPGPRHTQTFCLTPTGHSGMDQP